MKNKKSRIILLSLFLVILIALGTFIILNNTNNSENSDIAGDKTFNYDNINSDKDNENQINNNKDNENKESGKFYYTEEFISESLFRGGSYNNVFTINDEIAVCKEGYLQNVRTKENIIKLPNDISPYFSVNEEGFYDVKYDKDTKKIIFSSFDLEGNKKESTELKNFKGVVFEDSYIIISDVKVTKNYLYFLALENKKYILHIYTKTGELKNTYEGVICFDVDSAENVCISANITVKNNDGNPYIVYMVNSETGKEIFKNTSYFLRETCFSKDGKFIYGIGNEGEINIYSALTGGLIKPVFEFGIDSTYLLDDYRVQGMLIGKDDEIVWWMEIKPEDELSSEQSTLLYYLYTKQEGERPQRQVTLTITEPYRSEFVEEAIKLYELKYQDEHIEYNYAYNTKGEYDNNIEEYSAKQALDIIQGNVGDIVRMVSYVMGNGGADYQNLFRTDVFMDLTDLIYEDKNYEYLNKDILNAVKINDAIRGLPITYTFNLWELNEDFEKQLGLDLDFNNMSWSEILDLVKVIEEQFPDKHLFTSFGEGEVWEHFGFGTDLLTANMPDLINLETKEIDLNQQWFKDLLIKFKECSKSENFMLKVDQFDAVDNLKGSLLSPGISSGKGTYYNDSVYYYSTYNKLNKSRFVPTFAGEKNNNRVGYTKMMYSINNRSERKENAWKFLSFLLDEDKVQYAASRERGELISEKGFEYMLNKSVSMISLYDSKTNSKVDPYKTYREKYNKGIKEVSHKIDYLYDMGNIKNELFEAIKLYMKDEISLDEALKKAEEKILIRLNE